MKGVQIAVLGRDPTRRPANALPRNRSSLGSAGRESEDSPGAESYHHIPGEPAPRPIKQRQIQFDILTAHTPCGVRHLLHILLRKRARFS